jgi:hypothetical protein
MARRQPTTAGRRLTFEAMVRVLTTSAGSGRDLYPWLPLLGSRPEVRAEVTALHAAALRFGALPRRRTYGELQVLRVMARLTGRDP